MLCGQDKCRATIQCFAGIAIQRHRIGTAIRLFDGDDFSAIPRSRIQINSDGSASRIHINMNIISVIGADGICCSFAEN